MPVVTRSMAAAARLILAAADSDSISDSDSSISISDSDSSISISDSGSSTSVLQVVHAGAAVAGEEEEVTSQPTVEGSATSVVTGTALNQYLLAYGRIPMTRSEVIPDDVDLSALPAPPVACRRPPRYRPVICAYCNCAFCFGHEEHRSLDLGPGHVYPAPPSPFTLNLLTPRAALSPLYRPDPWGLGGKPELLLVCSNDHHFKDTMGMLQLQQPGGAPSLSWRWADCCLRVVPIVVGSEGSDSPDLRANPPPPLEPWRYAGAYWNYVIPGHENMVELKLHNDPLKLTLGGP